MGTAGTVNTMIAVDYLRQSRTNAFNRQSSHIPTVIADIADIADITGCRYRRLHVLHVLHVLQTLQKLQTSHLRDSAGIRRIIPGPLSCGSDSYALSVHDTELS